MTTNKTSPPATKKLLSALAGYALRGLTIALEIQQYRKIYLVGGGHQQVTELKSYRKKAAQWIFHHPGRFIVNGVKKILVLYHFDPMSWRTEKATLFRLGGLFPYGVVLPFIFWGILTRFRQRQLGIIVCYLLFNTLLAILFCGDSRLRAPMQPYLYLFSIFGFFDFYSLTKFLIKKTQRR